MQTNSLKSGTKISVYTADGQTLLYSYTVTAGGTATTPSNSPQLYDSNVEQGTFPNTGNIPWQKGGPMYIDYGTPPDRLGAMHFDIW